MAHRQTRTQMRTHTHSHPHHHSEGFEKKVSNRLSKAVGHLNKVKRMVEDDHMDCTEVLVQLLAVKSAIESTGKFILKEHMSHCIIDAAKEGDEDTIMDLNKLIDSFL